MTATEIFKTDIKNWLKKYGFGDLDLCYGEDFSYILNFDGKYALQIGVVAYPEIGRYFEQFLYEYGLEYSGIYDPVLSLLHELGHHVTYNEFTTVQKALYDLAKQFDHGESDQEWLNHYWCIPDEFAANMFVINYVNTHIKAVEELCDIYANDWNNIFKEVNISDLISEVA